MVRTLSTTEKDREILAGINYDPMKDLIDEPDYTQVLIKKPWGYEYLLFKNKDVAIWILHIEHDFRTSLHCHPNKKTSLTVLEGEVEFSTLHEKIRVKPGDIDRQGSVPFDAGGFACRRYRDGNGNPGL